MELPKNLRRLFKAAAEAQKKAFVPWSNHPIGAAVMVKSGRIYIGCNIEAPYYPHTPPGICAERVAIYNAYSAGDRKIEMILLISEGLEPKYPCSICQQVINDLAPNCVIVTTLVNGNMVKINPRDFQVYHKSIS